MTKQHAQRYLRQTFDDQGIVIARDQVHRRPKGTTVRAMVPGLDGFVSLRGVGDTASAAYEALVRQGDELLAQRMTDDTEVQS